MFDGYSKILLINISPFEIIDKEKIEKMFDNISLNVEKIITNRYCIEEYIKTFRNIQDKLLFQ